MPRPSTPFYAHFFLKNNDNNDNGDDNDGDDNDDIPVNCVSE